MAHISSNHFQLSSYLNQDSNFKEEYLPILAQVIDPHIGQRTVSISNDFPTKIAVFEKGGHRYQANETHGCPLQYRHTSFYCTSQIMHFLQSEGLWQPCIKQVYSNHFSQQHLLTSCLCVTFCQFCQYFKPSTSKITTTPPQTKNYSSLKALMMVSIFFFFTNKVFSN